MRKILLLSAVTSIFIIWGGVSFVNAEVNMPSAPSFNAPYVSSKVQSSKPVEQNNKNSVAPSSAPTTTRALPSSTNGGVTKAQLDSIAMAMLKAGERHDEAAFQANVMKLIDKGITGMCKTDIIARRSPKCPPAEIKVNGVKKSGNFCAYTCYEYNGKRHDVGYCK